MHFGLRWAAELVDRALLLWFLLLLFVLLVGGLSRI